MNYLTRHQIKEKYWYNQYQLINLKKNWKVRFKENPLMYCEEDIIKADKEDFIIEKKIVTRNINLWKYLTEEELKNIKDYMKTFWKEYRRTFMRLLNWEDFNYKEVNLPNSLDQWSCINLAFWRTQALKAQWENIKENFESWKKRKTKKQINDRKLYLQRKHQKIKFKEKDFIFLTWNDTRKNDRMKIENWYLYVPNFWKNKWKRKRKVFVWWFFSNWKQTCTIKERKWKLILITNFEIIIKKLKVKWACWIDVNNNNLSVALVDNNWCLRKRRTFQLWNIVNLRNKKVEIMKLLKKIKDWSWWKYLFVLEDLDLSWCYKNRKLSNIIYWQIRENSFMLWNHIKFVNPAYTSFIWLTKYSNLWMSIKHWWWSQDHSAAYVIARRWLWFKEKLPKFSHWEKMNNWKAWSYLKKNYWEDWTRKLFFK